MSDYYKQFDKLLEILQQIRDELRKLNRFGFEEQVQEISGCRWCGFGEGHHRDCPRYVTMR